MKKVKKSKILEKIRSKAKSIKDLGANGGECYPWDNGDGGEWGQH
jgi:hypothetical protein